MNILGLETNLEGKRIIELKTLSGFVKLSDFNIYINDVRDKNIYTNTNVYNQSSSVEILVAEVLKIDKENLKINKVNYNNSNIVFIHFSSNLLINLNINGVVNAIYKRNFVSHSLIYEHCIDNIYIYPINLDLNLTNHEIYFSITYAFLEDKFETYFEKATNDVIIPKEDDIITDFSDFRYIDINKEFM